MSEPRFPLLLHLNFHSIMIIKAFPYFTAATQLRRQSTDI